MKLNPKFRRVIWPLVSVTLLVAATWLALLWPPMFTGLIRWSLSRATGTRVEVDGARWDGWGGLSIDSIRVMADGWPGSSATLLETSGLHSTFRPLRLLAGTIALDDFEIEQACLRIAFREGTEEANYGAIDAGSGGGPSFALRPERVLIRTMRIENLVVRGSEVRTSETKSFRGELWRDPALNRNDLRFELQETETVSQQNRLETRPLPDGLRLAGRWNDRTFAYELDASRLDFTDTIQPLLPPVARDFCARRLALRGMVSDVTLRGSPSQPIEQASVHVRGLETNLDNLGLSLGIAWERFSRGARGPVRGTPRMSVDEGWIVFANDRLTLRDFSGRLFSIDQDAPDGAAAPERTVPLPVTLSIALDFSRLPTLAAMSDLTAVEAWLEAAYTHCGVEATLTVPEYALVNEIGEAPWAVELPEPIVNVLDNFKVIQGRLRIDATATRAPSEPGSPSTEPLVSGALSIRDGEGSYVNFRYPLNDVQADIGFRGERIDVRRLQARGRTGNRLEIEGKVDGAGDDAGVDLKVRTVDMAPIDLDLQNAFDEGPRRIFELLFARDMRDRLVSAGLLPEQGSELTGGCRFDIEVRRKRGDGSRVETTGRIEVENANVLCSRFPYPIRVKTGLIDLQDEAIVLPQRAWTFDTPGGGTGSIHGSVAIPRAPGGRLARPDLNIVVAEDHVNDLLLAAIPLEDWENGRSRNERWPGHDWSVAAQAMRALQVKGELNLGGRIGADPDGNTTLNIALHLVDGSFTPRNGPDHLLERAGLPWPEGFDLTDVRATVRLTETEARLERLTASAGDGTVEASGAASLRELDRTLEADLKRAPIGAWMVPLLPADVRLSAAEAWKRCDVQGTFDGSVDIRQRAGAVDERHATFTTDGVRFSARGVASELRITRGRLSIDGPTLNLDALRVLARCGERTLGWLEADGAIALDTGGTQDLRGRWSIDDFAGVLWPEVLRAANLPGIAALHDSWNPVGFAGGTLQVRRGADGQPDWDIEVTHDGVLAGDPGNVPVSLTLTPGGHLMFGPDMIGVRGPDGGPAGITGCLPGGEFALDGMLSLGPRGPADGGAMKIDFTIGMIDEDLVGVLPDDLASALRAIALRACEARSADLRLLGWTPETTETGLMGVIELEDASMRAGTELSRIHAPFGIDARGGRPDPVRVNLGDFKGTFVAKDRVFEHAGGTLLVGKDAETIRIVDLQADLYQGRAWAGATIGGPDRDWRLDVRVDGVSLPALIRGGASTQAFAALGEVRGSLSLGGELDADGSLRGIGHLEATDARMAELPLTLRMLQATQLMLPLADSLDRASLDFFVRGERLRFERFDLSCPTLRLLGSGSMDLGSWDVALRFRNRGVVPGISELFGAASDALFVIDVTGPAGDPKVNLTPLPPFGQDPSTQPPSPRIAAAHPKEP
jgi:hypothetical protein